MSRTRTWWVLAPLLTALVAGCSSSIAGHPQATSRASGGGATSQAPSASTSASPSKDSESGGSSSGKGGSEGRGGALERFRTTDPCSLVHSHTFDSLGDKVESQVVGASYTTCSISVRVSTKGKTTNMFGTVSLEGGLSPASYKAIYGISVHSVRRAGYTVLEGSSAKGGCIRGIRIAEDLTLVLHDDGGGRPCAIVDDMMTSVLRTVRKHDEAHRRLPAHSPAAADICAVGGKAAQKFIGGSIAATVPALHGCTWGNGPSILTVSLTSGSWPPSSASQADHQQISGHDAYTLTRRKGDVGTEVAQVKFGKSPLSAGGTDYFTIDARLASGAARLSADLTRFVSTLASGL